MSGNESTKLPNACSLVECTTKLECLVKKYGDNGFAIISAWKNPEESPDWNNDERSDELESDIQKERYSYTVCWGGYEKTRDNTHFESYKKSFVVYNCISSDNWHQNKEAGDIDSFRDFAVRISDKYEQDSVCFKEPGKPPLWINKNNLAGEKSSVDIESVYDLVSSCGIQFVKKQALGFQARYRQSCRGEIGVSM